MWHDTDMLITIMSSDWSAYVCVCDNVPSWQFLFMCPVDVMVWESFGPIIGIQEVKNDEEAVQLMNDTKYGLTAAVYTQSKQAAENILSRINSGTGQWVVSVTHAHTHTRTRQACHSLFRCVNSVLERLRPSFTLPPVERAQGIWHWIHFGYWGYSSFCSTKGMALYQSINEWASDRVTRCFVQHMSCCVTLATICGGVVW